MAVTRINGSKYLADVSITENKIANGAITVDKLGSDSVNADKLDENGQYTIAGLTNTGDENISGSLNINTDKFKVDGATGNIIGKGSVTFGNGAFTIDENGNTVIGADVQFSGTNTSIDATNLEVEDKNFVVNKGGNEASMTGSGVTVDNSEGTNGSLIYDSSTTSKWKVGIEGSEVELSDISSAQTLSSKTINLLNTISINGTDYTTMESAMIALNTVGGTAINVIEGDETSNEAGVLVYDDDAKTITIGSSGDVVSISAMYISGIRVREGDSHDYTISDNVITVTENILGNFTIEYKGN